MEVIRQSAVKLKQDNYRAYIKVLQIVEGKLKFGIISNKLLSFPLRKKPDMIKEESLVAVQLDGKPSSIGDGDRVPESG